MNDTDKDILRPVKVTITKYFFEDDTYGTGDKTISFHGYFHRWTGDDIVWGIVEEDNGHVRKVEPTCIQFLDREQGNI